VTAWASLALRWSLLGSIVAVMGWAVYLTASGAWRWLNFRRLERQRKALASTLQLTVLRREDHGPFMQLWLGPASQSDRSLPRYQAGDYLVLSSPTRQRRCYSLASWEHQPRQYELIIKHEEGGAVSGWAHGDLRPGVQIDTSRPRGTFRLRPSRQGVHVLVAAGVGITPLRAMLHQYLNRRGSKAPIALFWTVRHVSDLMGCHAEFLALAERHSEFRYFPHVTGPSEAWPGERTRVDAQVLVDKAGGVKTIAGVWICASAAMVERLRDGLVAQGMPEHRVHDEAFGAMAPVTARDCLVELAPTGQVLQYHAQPSLLHLFDETGIGIASECRTGQCGQCRVRLLAGDVEWISEPESRPPTHQVLACCVRPLKDVRVSLDLSTPL